MIKCFEQELRGIVISEVKQAKFFSVMADECSDVVNKEESAIVIRYVNEDDEICEDFVEFLECENGITGLALAEKIKSALHAYNAYNTFTELYTPLDNTLTYIAEHSSEFTSDTVKKSSSFLDGITEFQCIATLIIPKHILSTTQILSKSLQYRNAQDIVREWNHVKITHKRVKEIRQDVDKHQATWFSESTVMAKKVGEEPRIPRRCARQIQ